MKAIRPIFILFIAIFLPECSQQRPMGNLCKSVSTTPKATQNELKGLLELDQYKNFRLDIERIIKRKSENIDRLKTPEKMDRGLNILALSAGGQWGAFGSGFLKGWSTQPAGPRKRPKFDIVTGVSTGALMSPFAFLGKEYDEILETEYTSITNANIYRLRPLLKIPFSNSIYVADPLRRRLLKYISPELLDKIAVEREKGRGLYVAAANLDTGSLDIFDLTEIASKMQGQERQQRFIDCIMAAAALPLAFPPVFINGDMYVDGGARQHMFIVQIDKAVKDYAKKAGLKEPAQTIFYMIINGDLKVAPACTKNNLIAIGIRSVDVIVDQLLLSTVYQLYHETTTRGWRTVYVSAANTTCTTVSHVDDQFDKPFMQCLFDYGYKLGSQQKIPWISTLNDLSK